MLDDKTKALLGDRAAQERLTAAGVLLPCCGKRPIVKHPAGSASCVIECAVNGHIHHTRLHPNEREAKADWNNRFSLVPDDVLMQLFFDCDEQ